MRTTATGDVLVQKKEIQKRRRLESAIHNAFKRLQFCKKQSFFKHFEKKTATLSGITQVAVLLDEEDSNSTITVTFFIDNKHPKDCVVAEDHSYSFSVLIGFSVDCESLRLLLAKEFKKRVKGHSREDSFITEVPGIEKSNVKIISVIKASPLDDTSRGIDVFLKVTIDGKIYPLVPLQLKSSRESQKKHLKKFPQVPSLVYHPGLYTRKVLSNHLVEIIKAKAMHNASLHLH